MNWYKLAQTIQEQYAQLLQETANIQITGSGQNENLTIPGGKSITARELLDRVKMRLAPILTQNHVKEINTDPIGSATAGGLAISHEPGRIHVDLQKLFNIAKQALPPTSQFDGTQTDPDVINAIIDRIAYWIESSITEIVAHESQHVLDFTKAYETGQPFTSIQEQPAEQFGRRTKQQFFPRSLNY